MNGRKNAWIWIILLVVCLLLLAAAVAVGTLFVYHNGQFISRNCLELDMTDAELSPDDYKKLADLLPDCRIRWNIPIGGQKYDSFSKHIRIEHVNREDIPLFALFYDLQSIDAMEADCYDALIDLQAALPDCQIQWAVRLGNGTFSPDAQVLPLDGTGVTADELLQHLDLFSNFRGFILTDLVLDKNMQHEFMKRFPDAKFEWLVQIGEDTFLSVDKEITIQDPNVSAQELIEAGDKFYYLEQIKLDVTACAFTPQQLLDLREVYPGEIRCNIALCGVMFDSEVQELDLSGIPMDSTDQLEQILPLMPKLQRVIMCDCGISSEEMDALGKRNPQIRFIWNVRIGRAVLRTDVTAFIPCTYGYWPTGGVNPWKDAENRLFDEDCKEFRYCVDMVCLDLGHMGLTDISFLEYMPKLQYLILADNPIEDFSALQYLPELVHLELFMTKFDQADVLVGLKELETVNLGYTRPKNWEPLKEMTWLEMLWLPGTKLSEDSYQQIVDALPNTLVDYTGEHSTDHGWRNSDNYREMRDLLGMRYLE